MVIGILTSEMQEAGAALTRILVESETPPCAAFWLHKTELNEWRLVFGIEAVDRIGPLKVYKRVRSLLSRNRDAVPGIDLEDVSVVSPRSGLAAALRGYLPARSEIAGVRLHGEAVEGHYVEDAFVYRVS